ncbi:cytochrome P450 [Pilobolus umbonatus]|nr:cytochrome P450 [Pilobolus umbonatus]
MSISISGITISLPTLESIRLPYVKDNNKIPLIGIAAATSLLLYSAYKTISGSRDPFYDYKGTKDIPTPGSAYPLVGHLMSLGSLPHRKIAAWHEELGPIIRIRMGVQNWISISDAQLAHKIFVSNGVNASNRPKAIFHYKYHSRQGRGVLAAQPDGNLRAVRAAILGALSPKHLPKYYDMLEKESNHLLNNLIDTTERQGSVDPFHALEFSTVNVIMSISFAQRFESVYQPEFLTMVSVINEALRLAGPINDLAGFIPSISFLDYLIGSQVKMQQFIKNRRDPTFEKIIEQALQSDRPNLIKTMKLEYSDLNDDDILVLGAELCGAGIDTIANTLYWNFAIMCNYPMVQVEVRKELDEFMKKHGRWPKFDERESTPYSYSVIRECMRFKSIVTILVPHAAAADISVDGYVIPKGSVLITPNDLLHMDNEKYFDPEKFIPERFINSSRSMMAASNGKLEDRDHYNFGWGRRICPGIQLADIEIYNAFVRVYSTCIVEPDGKFPSLVDLDKSNQFAPERYKIKFTKRSEGMC